MNDQQYVEIMRIAETAKRIAQHTELSPPSKTVATMETLRLLLGEKGYCTEKLSGYVLCPGARRGIATTHSWLRIQQGNSWYLVDPHRTYFGPGKAGQRSPEILWGPMDQTEADWYYQPVSVDSTTGLGWFTAGILRQVRIALGQPDTGESSPGIRYNKEDVQNMIGEKYTKRLDLTKMPPLMDWINAGDVYSAFAPYGHIWKYMAVKAEVYPDSAGNWNWRAELTSSMNLVLSGKSGYFYSAIDACEFWVQRAYEFIRSDTAESVVHAALNTRDSGISTSKDVAEGLERIISGEELDTRFRQDVLLAASALIGRLNRLTMLPEEGLKDKFSISIQMERGSVL